MARRITWTHTARNDLERIKAFINVGESPAARKFIRKLVAAPRSLRDFPELGRSVPELEADGLGEREIIVGSYRMIYSHTPQEIVILRILRDVQDFENAW